DRAGILLSIEILSNNFISIYKETELKVSVSKETKLKTEIINLIKHLSIDDPLNIQEYIEIDNYMNIKEDLTINEIVDIVNRQDKSETGKND
ncbi:31709_t:CDS:1, partial [Racocetra persica]